MYIKTAEILILLFMSLISDIKTYKIKNEITLSFAGIGLITNLALMGFKGFVFSITGWLVPVAVLFVLYFMRMLGAGDIKLFGAIGAVTGCEFAIYSIAYSFLFGGIVGVIFLIVRKNAGERFKYFFTFLKSCFLTFKLLDYSNFKDNKGDDKFRFSYAVFPGTLMQLMITFFNF